jgi:hypothetical protein
MSDQGVADEGRREAYIRITIMELISCLNDVVELTVELASESGVETFLQTLNPHRKGGAADSSEGAALSSSLAMSNLSGDSSRQLAFNKAWREARRDMRGYVHGA